MSEPNPASADVMNKLRELVKDFRREADEDDVKHGQESDESARMDTRRDCAKRLEALLPALEQQLDAPMNTLRQTMKERDHYSNKVATLEQRERELREALQGMLLSQDASWEQNNLGHDWKDACQKARAALNPTESK